MSSEHDKPFFLVRDRSWGKLRNEGHLPVPPMVWMTGVFNENFYFIYAMAQKT